MTRASDPISVTALGVTRRSESRFPMSVGRTAAILLTAANWLLELRKAATDPKAATPALTIYGWFLWRDAE